MNKINLPCSYNVIDKLFLSILTLIKLMYLCIAKEEQLCVCLDVSIIFFSCNHQYQRTFMITSGSVMLVVIVDGEFTIITCIIAERVVLKVLSLMGSWLSSYKRLSSVKPTSSLLTTRSCEAKPCDEGIT